MKLACAIACLGFVAPALAAQDSGAVRLRLQLEDLVQVGRAAPAVVLPYATAAGPGPADQPFDLSRELGRTVTLVFSSSLASPGVSEGLRTIAGRIQPWLDSGVVVAAVSPDPSPLQVRLAHDMALPFKLLSDNAAAVARRFGFARLRANRYAVVVVGRDGRVRWVDAAFDPRAATGYVHLDVALRAAREIP